MDITKLKPEEIALRSKMRITMPASEEMTKVYGEDVQVAEDGTKYIDVQESQTLREYAASMNRGWVCGEPFFDTTGLDFTYAPTEEKKKKPKHIEREVPTDIPLLEE